LKKPTQSQRSGPKKPSNSGSRVHVERLPWQLGADFFFRHLLDGDPASNTLSWRWVAGLQTPGKTYLPRRSNLEKYLPPGILAMHPEGLELLEQPQALILPAGERPAITRPSLPPTPPLRKGRLGIWIHEEDLLIEQGPLASLEPCAILATGDTATWTRCHYPERKITWLRSALNDAAMRAGSVFGVETQVHADSSANAALLRWACANHLQQVVAMRPEIGPIHDQAHELQIALANAGIDLVFLDRSEDLALRPFATAGFFGFWEKMQKSWEAHPPH
jgi:deoxyribodipyrimidine photo-lyase